MLSWKFILNFPFNWKKNPAQIWLMTFSFKVYLLLHCNNIHKNSKVYNIIFFIIKRDTCITNLCHVEFKWHWCIVQWCNFTPSFDLKVPRVLTSTVPPPTLHDPALGGSCPSPALGGGDCYVSPPSWLPPCLPAGLVLHGRHERRSLPTAVLHHDHRRLQEKTQLMSLNCGIKYISMLSSEIVYWLRNIPYKSVSPIES